jgi:hypothetical protein
VATDLDQIIVHQQLLEHGYAEINIIDDEHYHEHDGHAENASLEKLGSTAE